MTAEAPVEETLAWEAEKRPRIATIALLGGLTTIAGNVLFTIVLSRGPTSDDGLRTLTESLGAAVSGRELTESSLRVRTADFFGEQVLPLSVSTILQSIGTLCLALLMLFLWRAAAARSSDVGRLPYYAALAAAILVPLGHTVGGVAQWLANADFADASVRTAEAAREINGEPAIGVGLLLDALGSFALATAVVIISMAAMRVGLLTRFFGVLGIIIGVLPILGLLGLQLDQPGIIRGFWFIGVGLVIAGRLKVPLAWQTGRAEPWPTRQQLVEQREAERKAAAGPPAGEPKADKPAELRKKRKRRR